MLQVAHSAKASGEVRARLLSSFDILLRVSHTAAARVPAVVRFHLYHPPGHSSETPVSFSWVRPPYRSTESTTNPSCLNPMRSYFFVTLQSSPPLIPLSTDRRNIGFSTAALWRAGVVAHYAFNIAKLAIPSFHMRKFTASG